MENKVFYTFKKNAVSVLFLAACPALATTQTVKASLGMALASVAVIVISSLIVELMKKFTEKDTLTVVTVVVTATTVAAVQMLMAAYLSKAYSLIGVYLAVCAMNAMYASYERSFKEALITAVWFALLVIIMGALREVIGNGTFLGLKVPFFNTFNVPVFSKTSGGFIVFSILLAVSAAICNKEEK